MAIELLIKQGDLELNDKDYLSAISNFSKAIKENPKCFQAYLKRSIAYQRMKNYERAVSDISEAFTLAEERGKRNEIADCYYRLGMIHYSSKDVTLAYKNFKKAKEFDCKEPSLSVWISKCEYELKGSEGLSNDSKKVSEVEDSEVKDSEVKDDVSQVKESLASTSLKEINKHAPLKVKIREDWYQSNQEVTITIYAKNIKAQEFSIEYGTRSIGVSFPNGPGSEYNYNLDPLYGEIDKEKSSFKVFGTKIEIYLWKKDPIHWKTLEGSSEDTQITHRVIEESKSSLTYPTSSKKSINWSNFKLDDDEDTKDQSETDFFANLYKDLDEDSRRAMMKSYTQSNGTVLTTNWDDAKTKQFETSPPEGMKAKKWGT